MDEWFQGLLGMELGLVVSILVKIVIVLVPLILTVAYLTYFERKVIGYMQLRVGPNVTGPWGLIQPFADVFKLLLKEVIVPDNANKWMYFLAPVMVLMPSFAVWAVIPVSEEWVMSNVNTGVLFVLAIAAMGVYGLVVGGWSSNSKYAFLGGMRSAAQIISYELAMGFSILGVVMVSGSLRFDDIVASQAAGLAGGSIFSWNWLALFPLFVIYSISGVAETNRAPFDVSEGESEIVAGFHVEYSGFVFALFFLAEYINMIVVSALISLLFLGGWLSPFPASWGWIGQGSAFWMFLKMALVLFWYFWLRSTFPRFRYDQIMRLGWKVFLPVTMVAILALAAWMASPLSLWK